MCMFPSLDDSVCVCYVVQMMAITAKAANRLEISFPFCSTFAAEKKTFKTNVSLTAGL